MVDSTNTLILASGSAVPFKDTIFPETYWDVKTGGSLTTVTVIATVSVSVAPSASVESTVSMSDPLKSSMPW
ncbi:MAG: hypothetical protein RLZZ221_2799 [Verrucomicrobiota bacterium]